MARRASHPGEHLAQELTVLDMSAAALARALEVPANGITARVLIHRRPGRRRGFDLRPALQGVGSILSQAVDALGASS